MPNLFRVAMMGCLLLSCQDPKSPSKPLPSTLLEAPFKAPELPNSPPLFGAFFVSDLHTGRDPAIQKEVRDAMEHRAQLEPHFELIIAGGDLSDHGLKPDFLAKELLPLYQDPLVTPRLALMPFHAVLGNHDYCASDPTTLFTSEHPKELFRLDDLVWHHETKKKDLTIGWIYVDTTILAYYPHLPSWLEESCGRMGSYLTQLEKSRGGKGALIAYMKTKIQAALSAYEAHDYLIVVGHHAIGGGACGHEPGTSPEGGTKWLHTQVKAHQVSAYLAGHVHVMDFGRTDSTLFMAMGTSGSVAGRGCLNQSGWHQGKWEHRENGFGALRFYEDELYLTYYNQSGDNLLTQAVKKRQRTSRAP